MQQSRLESLIEAMANVIVGCGIALASQLAIFPLFGIHVPLSTNFAIMGWFTMISVVRSYCLRRWFNARLHRVAAALSKRLTG